MHLPHLLVVIASAILIGMGTPYEYYNGFVDGPPMSFGGGYGFIPPYGGGYDLWPQYGYDFDPHFGGDYASGASYGSGFTIKPFFDGDVNEKPQRNGHSKITRLIGQPVTPTIKPSPNNELGAVIGGSCPRVRLACPSTRSQPITCTNDAGCSPGQKCCFDICLQQDTCKTVEPDLSI